MQPLWIPPGKAAPIFNSFEINVCLFLRICTVFKPPIQFIHNNYFWLKLNCLISLWYSAVPNTISPLRQKIFGTWCVNYAQKYHLFGILWHLFDSNFSDSLYIFGQRIICIFIYPVPTIKRRSYKCHNKSIGALDNKHPHNYHTQLQYAGWLKIPCLIKNVHLFFSFGYFAAVWQEYTFGKVEHINSSFKFGNSDRIVN